MCEICEKVKTVDFFPTAKAYLDCLKYILISQNNYTQVEAKS